MWKFIVFIGPPIGVNQILPTRGAGSSELAPGFRQKMFLDGIKIRNP